MKKDFLRTARQWIDFKESHWNAILKAYEIVTQNPTLVSLFENDVARTDGELTMPLKEMKESYGAVMAIYPTLPLLAHVPELVERYQEKGIPEEILRDTLSDIPLWIENAERRTGEIALLEYGWLSRYVRMELFRLGRLEFALSENGLKVFAVQMEDKILYLEPEGEYDGKELKARQILENGTMEETKMYRFAPEQIRMKKGDLICEVHIPEGEPMLPEAVNASFEQAESFFRTFYGANAKAYQCESWLISPAWERIGLRGNIREFSNRFRIVELVDDTQMFERVFDTDPIQWNEMPEGTTLQRKIREAYRQGMRCVGAYGVILCNTK